MGPRTRLSLLAALILLGVGLWLVRVIAPPGDTVPDYTVLNRLPAAADVVIPSLSREDEDREQVLRAIAAIEDLDPAFFFSTEEAVEAHQALLPSTDQLEDLQAGFLGQVRGGEFTPGEDVYPD